jgi:hypothetical protein
MPLERELATFKAMKPELVRDHSGTFVLIKGERFIGAFERAGRSARACRWARDVIRGT